MMLSPDLPTPSQQALSTTLPALQSLEHSQKEGGRFWDELQLVKGRLERTQGQLAGMVESHKATLKQFETARVVLKGLDGYPALPGGKRMWGGGGGGSMYSAADLAGDEGGSKAGALPEEVAELLQGSGLESDLLRKKSIWAAIKVGASAAPTRSARKCMNSAPPPGIGGGACPRQATVNSSRQELQAPAGCS
jgi:hypothetical protein